MVATLKKIRVANREILLVVLVATRRVQNHDQHPDQKVVAETRLKILVTESVIDKHTLVQNRDLVLAQGPIPDHTLDHQQDLPSDDREVVPAIIFATEVVEVAVQVSANDQLRLDLDVVLYPEVLIEDLTVIITDGKVILCRCEEDLPHLMAIVEDFHPDLQSAEEDPRHSLQGAGITLHPLTTEG